MASLSASLAIPLPPLPPIHLALQSLSIPPGGDYPSSLMVALQDFDMPSIQLLAGLPILASLSAVASLALTLKLPNLALNLTQMMSGFDPAILAPTLSLDLNALLSLEAYASAALNFKDLFGVAPWDVNVSAAISAALGGGSIVMALTIPTPEMPHWVLGKLAGIQQISLLMSIAATFGVDLSTPSGVSDLAVAIKPLIRIALPSLNLSLDLLARIKAIATITAAFGVNTPPATLRMMLSAMISLKLPLPNINIRNALPSRTQVESVLALNLPSLNVAWNFPETLPIVAALPILSLAVQLNLMLPVLNFSPCGSGCPMGG